MDTATYSSQFQNLTGKITISNLVPIFSGNYSSVHLGKLKESSAPIAIKIIREVGETTSVKRKLLREMTVWSTASHANIYPFYGYANDKAFGPFGALISPWCQNGDAGKFLNEHGEKMIIAERVKLWQGVIDGVAYLHRSNPPIVHGDLKPGNVLIDEDGTPRICDFGLARIFFDESGTGLTTTSEHTGTARYLAPELVTETNVPPTFESDVYALGSRGLEFIYLQKPYANHANNRRGQIYQDLRRGLPPAMTQPTLEWPAHRLWPLLLDCWTAHPPSRPLVMTIGRNLQRTILSFPIAVFQRIISILITSYQIERDHDYLERRKFYGQLHSLCLVSRSCYSLVVPILYGEIRLGPKSFPDRISLLLHTLESSKKGTPLSHYAPNGYGAFAHKVFLHFHDTHTDSQIFSWVQATIQLTPNLRYVQLSIGYLSYWPQKRTPLITLDLSGIPTSFFKSYIPALLEMTGAQQVYISRSRFKKDKSLILPTEFRSPYPSTLPKVVLLNLHIIKLDFISASIFHIMSTWVLPQLSSLALWVVEINPADMEALYGFLRFHGDRLHNIGMYTDFEQIHVTDVLQLCPNLRWIRLELPDPSFDFSAMSHPHPKLERIIARAGALDEEGISVFCGLKTAAIGVFPHLVDAEVFNVDTGKKIASFRMDESFISVYKSRRVVGSYKIYDDGRRSPPPIPTLIVDHEMSYEPGWRKGPS